MYNATHSTANNRTIISPLLARDLTHQSVSPPVELSAAQRSELVRWGVAQMNEGGHVYHNAVHVQRVIERVNLLAQAAALDPREAQLLELGAAFHDLGHSGCTYRQLVPGAPRSDLSNEEYAAIRADEQLAGCLCPAQRLTVQGLILATSFGQADPEGIPAEIREVAYRPYRPVTLGERMLAFADVSNALGSFATFDSESAAMAEEQGVRSLPATIDGYFRRQLSFLEYVQSRLEAISAALPAAAVAQYQGEIEVAREGVAACILSPARADSTEMGRTYRRLSGT